MSSILSRIPRRPWLSVLSLLGALSGSSSADAADWAGFLQLSGFLGEVIDKRHPNWSEVQAFSQGVDAVVAGAQGRGLARFQPLVVTRTLDRSSPELFLAAATGRIIDSGVLVLHRPAVDRAEFLRIDLSGVQVAGITSRGVAGQPVSEELSFVFRAISVNSVKIVVKRRESAVALSGVGSRASSDDSWLGGSAAPGEGFVVGADSDAWLGSNLLRNPGAEAGRGLPAAWRAEGGFGAHGYGTLSGIPGGSGHGENLFAMRADSEAGSGVQVVDVSGAALEIDAGQLQAVLAGWFGGGTTEPEQEAARFVAFFRDAAGSALGNVRIGSVDTESASMQPELLRMEQAGRVPPGTRAVEVMLEFHRSASGGAAAYADDLSLVLEELSAGSGELPVRIQLLRAVGSMDHSQVQLSWTPDAGGVVVESAARLEGPWRRESVVTRRDNERETCLVPSGGDASVRFWRIRSASALR